MIKSIDFFFFFYLKYPDNILFQYNIDIQGSSVNVNCNVFFTFRSGKTPFRRTPDWPSSSSSMREGNPFYGLIFTTNNSL